MTMTVLTSVMYLSRMRIPGLSRYQMSRTLCRISDGFFSFPNLVALSLDLLTVWI